MSALSTTLPPARHLVAVVAHPDDEAFGLGALLAAYAAAGTRVDVVCLTGGERSSLGAGGDLAGRRAAELRRAVALLGVQRSLGLAHPDGALAEVAPDRLVAQVREASAGADALLAYDRGGVTGHPDHDAATAAAVAVGQLEDRWVWGWALPASVAACLRQRTGVGFVGRDETELDVAVTVDRTQQRAAMACHASQLEGNPVPWRRLALQGPVEHLRVLHRPTARAAPAATARAAPTDHPPEGSRS